MVHDKNNYDICLGVLSQHELDRMDEPVSESIAKVLVYIMKIFMTDAARY
jgi:hypothetical protein